MGLADLITDINVDVRFSLPAWVLHLMALSFALWSACRVKMSIRQMIHCKSAYHFGHPCDLGNWGKAGRIRKGRACVAFYVMQHEQEEESRWELTLHCTIVNNIWVGCTEVPGKAGCEGLTLMLFLHFLSESCTWWCVSRLSCQQSTIQKHKKEAKISSIQTRQWECWLEIIKSKVLHTFK